MYTPEQEKEFDDLHGLLNKYGDVVKEKRKSLGLTQKEVSDTIGISRSTLSLIENNKDVALNSVQTVIRYLKYWNIVPKNQAHR